MWKNNAVKSMFQEQMKWAVLLLIILLFLRGAHYLLYFFLPDTELMLSPFIEASHQPAKIYMLITGVLSIFFFLDFFVKHGRTRKLFFTGNVLVSLLIALILSAAVYLFTGVGYFLLSIFNLQAALTASFPFDTDITQAAGIVVFTLTIWFYYIMGMLIGSAFYRFGGAVGSVFVFGGVVLLFVENYLWVTETFLTGLHPLDLPVGIILLFVAGAALLMLLPAYMIIKDIRIKIK